MSHFLFTVRLWAEKSGVIVDVLHVHGDRQGWKEGKKMPLVMLVR